MSKSDDNRCSADAGHVSVRKQTTRPPFRRVLHVQQSPGFLAELRNPGLWNDFVVEMVGLFRVRSYDCSRVRW